MIKRSRYDWMKKECRKHGYFYMFIMQVQVKNNACRCYSVTHVLNIVYILEKNALKSQFIGEC